MNFFKALKCGLQFVFDKKIRFSYMDYIGWYNKMSDEDYLRKKFKIYMNRELDLNNPKTFNEKLQWLKLYNRNPIYTILVDKIEVKKYVAELIGEEYIIPTLKVYKKVDQIDFSTLPERFVLKCNHNSGKGMCICREKSKLDIKEVIINLENGLNENYYFYGREWPYKNVFPKIFAEKLMTDSDKNSDKALIDYKFFCFDGEADSVMVCTERETGIPKFYFFDKNWELMRYNIRGKEAPDNFSLTKPECIDEMFALAEKLSKGIPFVRVDLYYISGLIYFGEMTFYPDSGFDANLLKETDCYWGDKLELPSKY